METPIIPISIKPVGENIPNDTTFTVKPPDKAVSVLVQELGHPNIEAFTQLQDKNSMTSKQKQDLIDAGKAEIEWIKEKLAFKLRKPMWQNETDPRSKEKLIRMFNRFVKRRLDLVASLGGQI
jgi:hypothetical protein